MRRPRPLDGGVLVLAPSAAALIRDRLVGLEKGDEMSSSLASPRFADRGGERADIIYMGCYDPIECAAVLLPLVLLVGIPTITCWYYCMNGKNCSSSCTCWQGMGLEIKFWRAIAAAVKQSSKSRSSKVTRARNRRGANAANATPNVRKHQLTALKGQQRLSLSTLYY